MYSRQWRRPLAGGSTGRPGFVTEFAQWDDEQAAAAVEIEAHLDQVDLVRVAFCDPHGLARSKTLSAEAFRAVLRNGMDFSPGPFIFDTGHAVAVDFTSHRSLGLDEITGAGDFVVVPDPRTFQLLPHLTPRTAWVLGDEFLRNGSRHPLSTRDALRRVLARYDADGLSPVIGLEVEWYLTRRLPGAPGNAGNGFGRQGAAPSVVAMNAGYQFNLDSFYDSVAPITDELAGRFLSLGLPVRSMEHESGPGQIETTFDPLTALDAADAVVFFRTLVKQLCARAGYHASFMSLPAVDGFDPSGWHLHQSIVQMGTGRNLFAVESPASPAPDSSGLTPEGKAYIEGLLTRASDFCLLSVPTVNGYRRLDPAFSLSPTRIGWAFEDRGAMVRIQGGGDATHFENRVGEPCANPYLSIAAQLSAGLDGLRGSSEPGGGGDTLPQSLAQSLLAFQGGPAEALLGQPLTSCLIALKESELSRYHAWCASHHPGPGTVTVWEQREYFETY